MADPETWTLPYKPSEVQLRAHALQVDELLAGGAAGGGKSAMLLGYAITHCLAIPGAKAILFRRSFPELEAEIEPRLLEWVPSEVGKYNSSKHVMNFPNGSQLRLGYLEKDQDIYRYQGVQASVLLFDELTQFNWDHYTYLKSRLRASGKALEAMNRLGIKPRVISTTNPGGNSHHQVKEYFVDVAPPNTVYTDPETGLTRAYVPFKFTDNSYIDTEEYGRQLAGLPEHMRRALMDGDWEILEGVRFPQFRERIHVIKPEDLPIPPVGVVRVVGVDYGINDPMAAVWAAKVGETIVVYRDHVETGLAASQQAERVLELESEEERLHSDVTVALDPNGWARNPHFGGKKLMPGSDEAPLGSIAYSFRQALGDRVVKGWNPRVQGWAILDELMIERDTGVVDENGEPVKLPRILIYDTCRELIKALQSAPRSKRNPQDVDTSWAHDHVCLVAGTQVSTAGGPRPIESIAVGDMVWTRNGLRVVTDSQMTDPAAEVGTVMLSTGEVLTGTADHPVFLESGEKIRLDSLRYGDRLVGCQKSQSKANPSPTAGTPIHGGRILPGGRIGSIFGAAAGEVTSIALPTRTTTGQSLMEWWSITRTTTRSTMTRQTSDSPLAQTTRTTTLSNVWKTLRTGLGCKTTLPGYAPSRQTGTGRKRVVSGTASTASKRMPGVRSSHSYVSSAAALTKPSTGARERASARTAVRRRGGALLGLMTLTVGALRAARPLGSTGTVRSSAAPVHVVKPYAPLPGRQAVYNLTVNGEHEYYANGVLVSNCDAIRYACAEILGMSYRAKPGGHELLRRESANRALSAGLQEVRL